MSIFDRLQTIDRRWIYLVLVISLVISLRLAKPTDPVVLSTVQDVYNQIEQAPAGPGEGKIIVLGTTFSPSTLGENGNQLRALARHLLLAHKRFAIVSFGEPQGPIMGKAIVESVARQYGAEYGTDWIAFPYRPLGLASYVSFARDIPKAVGTDAIQGKPLGSFPIMQGIKSIHDVALVVDITASNSVFSWITYVQGTYGLKVGYSCTGVMAAEAYPFLDSGQLFGMLPGLKGAADYERLVDEREAKMVAAGELKRPFDYGQRADVTLQPARKLMFTQDTAHLVIIGFIILGNIGLLLSRRRAKMATKGAE